MKRLFTYVGFSMLISFTIVFYLGIFFSGIIILFSVLIILSALLIKRFKLYRKAMVVVGIVTIASGLYSMCYTSFFFEPQSDKYDNQLVDVSAILKSDPYTSHNTRHFELSSEYINGNAENCKILLKTNNQLDIDYGDRIKCKLILTKCKNNYYKSKGYLYEGCSKDYFLKYSVNKTDKKDIGYFPIFIKNKLCHSISTVLTGEESNLCRAVALGDKYSLSDNVYNDFSKTGLTYLIVVSGLHMSIVSFFILFLLKPLSNRKTTNIIRCIITIIFVLLFMAITGFTSSVVRSGVMTLLTLVGSGIWRRSDSLNNLGLSAIILLCLNPYGVGDIGLLYSFASVWGIVVIYPRIMGLVHSKLSEYKFYKTVIGHRCIKIIDMLMVSLSAVICITPISLINFGTFNPLVIVLSIFVSPIISILLVLVLICSVFWYIPFLSFISYATGFVAYYLAKYVLAVVSFGVNIPFSKITVSQDLVVVWLIVSALMLLIVFPLKNRNKLYKYVLIVSYAFLVLELCVNIILDYNRLTVDFYDTGKGTTAVANIKGQKTVLSSGGDSYHLSDTINRLSENCSNVDTLIVPSSKNYDSRYANNILEEFDVNSVLLYYKYTTNETVYKLATNCEKYREITNNQTVKINLGCGITDEIICTNNHSWQYIKNDKLSILIAPAECSADELSAEYQNVDILVLSKEIEDYEKISYKNIIWTSDNQIPDCFKNAVSTKGKTVTVNME